MGDRNNPIKFGPEWLRNMPRERSMGRSSNNNSTNNQNNNSGTTMSSNSSSGAGAAATTTVTTSNTSGTPKVLLAKLRYGREEMLALYDRNSDAPIELKSIDTLYQPRGKQPVALNNTFEDDMRDNLRGPPPIGGISSGDRFGMGRGAGRGVTNDGRCRPRGSYVRSPVTGRGGHYIPKVGGPRMPYSGGADDDSGIIRPWTNNNLNNRNTHDQTDWATKMFRSKRQGSNTNWRQQQSRDEGEEWRSSEPGRSRQVEKWDRDWGDRPSGEKPQSWNTNRRTWVAGDTHTNEENLPEWAGENAECGGTFDSSGAFHGYSNDDTNLPKHQDSSYSLTRSHTHGSFPRSKAIEEGSEEWWASEKAKKLSPKRFDASDLKFKKQSGAGVADVSNVSNTTSKPATDKEETVQKSEEKHETATASEPPEDNVSQQEEDKYNHPPPNVYKSKFAESKTFDAMMRSDINVEEATDEKGNFQSVIIASNNSLRQKHQHIVMAPDGQKHIRISLKNPTEIDPAVHKSHEDLLVDNIFGMTLDDEEMLTTSLSGMTMDMHANKQNMQMSMQSGHSIPSNQTSAMPSASIQKLPGLQIQSGGLQNPGIPSAGIQTSGLTNPNMSTVGLQNPGLPPSGMQTPGIMSGIQVPRVQTPGMQPVVQQVGITNSALNASLGLPIGPGPNMSTTLQGVQQQVMTNSNNIGASNMGVLSAASLQVSNNMPSFPSNNGLPGMSGNNVGNNSLFLGQNTNNPPLMSSSNEMPLSNHGGQNNMFPLHGLQHSRSQASFANSIYSNSGQNLDQWYYEDPERNIQGPFSSKDMYNWYRAGFFSPSLMVRRACDTMMRPLGSYGVVPFLQMDTMPGFAMPGSYESRTQGAHENILNSQPSLGLDVMNISNMNVSNNTHVDNLQFGSVRLMAKQSFGQPQQMVESLWSQPSTSADLMWMQQPLPRSEARVNNLPIFFWDQQPTAITSNSSLLPEDITKEMKTEDQILAQLRASQNIGQSGLQFIEETQAPTPPAVTVADDGYPPMQNTTPNLEELHKLIQKDTLTGNANTSEEMDETQVKNERTSKEQNAGEPNAAKKIMNKTSVDVKTKLLKDNEKSIKNKENNNTKNKAKKSKEEKKDDVVEVKAKDAEVKPEKRSQESSPAKNKKEDKSNKKELEREKKEWIKDGFTLVKGSEKNATNKDTKKKAEEARIAEEAERKRKEDEKLAAEEEKKKNLAESARKQQEQQQQQQLRQVSESLIKKAPWSAVATQAMQATNRDGPTLAEIQRLEREKKLEQIKEQQQMMHLIAQQQAAAYAREQEVQASLGWAKKKATCTPGQSLAEIQAEARKQAAATAAAAAQALEEAQAAISLAPVTPNHVPWGNTQNGVGGFWESLLDQPQKQSKPENPKPVDQKPKKKQTLIITPPKKEVSPALEFDNWCSGTLATWNSKIDVPTFIAFLKDIESPYEVKDYVKYYLGESKDSNDFARQFLEKRSKLLRVGTVTPSDDLCSPAIAVNPRTNSGSDYQEAEARKQAAATAAAAAQALEEAQAAISLAPVTPNHVPWGNTQNGVGGFWESLLDQPQKQSKPENPKPVDQKPKKKQTLIITPPKKEVSPALEFDNWCSGTLATWNSKIDVPTFIAFLKDIESPYEVKDYVKYYLGESKDSNDFARQFLEKRSKLLRVGTVTPSDDLCSPAIAVNPRTNSGSDYQEAEARKQAAATAAAAAQALEEAQAAISLAPVTPNHVPWGNTQNGVGGFWESLLDQPQKQSKPENPKPVDQKPKKKQTLIITPPKKEVSPALEFDNWCSGTLATWNSKIDVPTFIAFLKDIESPYEVKDYVKYYLGESKDSNDFARQFLEKRSKLLRVGTVTPSDDLCSPAIAVNPRTNSGSDYQEVKGKGKKTKKNKMLKVDARILGFSVTAAEDRINVGDIDTV